MVAEIARTDKTTTLDAPPPVAATAGFSVIPVYLYPDPKLAPLVRELFQIITSCPTVSFSI